MEQRYGCGSEFDGVLCGGSATDWVVGGITMRTCSLGIGAAAREEPSTRAVISEALCERRDCASSGDMEEGSKTILYCKSN